MSENIIEKNYQKVTGIKGNLEMKFGYPGLLPWNENPGNETPVNENFWND